MGAELEKLVIIDYLVSSLVVAQGIHKATALYWEYSDYHTVLKKWN